MRPRRQSWSGVALALTSLLAISVSTPLYAQSKTECAQAFAEAQSLRNELKLQTSLARFSACARDECPALVRADCAQGFEQVTRDLPTVIVGARDSAGRDLVDTRVFIDGAPLANDARGASIPLDPGQHAFRIEHPDYVTVEETALIRVGERNRSLVVTLQRKASAEAPLAPTPPAPAPSAPGPIAQANTDDPTNGRRTAAYVIGGVGIAAVSVGAAFGIAAAARCGGFFRDPCDAVADARPEERSDVRDSVTSQTWIANVGFGLGIVAIGTAAVLLLWPSRQSQGAVFRGAPIQGTF